MMELANKVVTEHEEVIQLERLTAELNAQRETPTRSSSQRVKKASKSPRNPSRSPGTRHP